MKWSNLHLFTLKEAPQDAEIISHQLMVRGGFIKKLAPGIYTYGVLGLKTLRRFENIVREELEKVGCLEILMPMVHPRELWEETNRWKEMGAGLLKFKNRGDQDFCLGATHEEAVVDYVRGELKSYRDLPKTLYQIQTKYRDEIRPRFGLMRGREFLMKDAYSFDLNSDEAIKTYWRLFEAYKAIFDRLGLKYQIVQADAGNIGGSQTHEFQLLAQAGEDALLVSEKGDFAANAEICPVFQNPVKGELPAPLALEKFATPGLRTIDELANFLKMEPDHLVKTLFLVEDIPNAKPFCILLRGPDEANPIKIKNGLGLSQVPRFLNPEEVKQLTGASPGSCGPQGLSCPVYADLALERTGNWIVGANQDDFHVKNVNPGRDVVVKKYGDYRLAREGDLAPDGVSRLQAYRGIEVGHVFYLGTKYSKVMGLQYLDRNGKAQPVEMGCYGIGVSRTMQACIEQCHDQDGMIWPLSISPYLVHLVILDVKDETVRNLGFQWEQQLESQGVMPFVDDRDERPGFKFKDADLLGFPFRVNVSKRALDAGVFEIVERKTKQVHQVERDQVLNWLTERCTHVIKPK